MIDVLLVDDHQYVLDAFRDALIDDPNIRIVGEARDGAEALRVIDLLRPQVVVMDLVMPVLDGISATRQLPCKAPVLVVTVHEEPQYLLEAVAAGAVGCVPKWHAGSELPDAITAIARGETYFSPQIPTDVRHDLLAQTRSA